LVVLFDAGGSKDSALAGGAVVARALSKTWRSRDPQTPLIGRPYCCCMRSIAERVAGEKTLREMEGKTLVRNVVAFLRCAPGDDADARRRSRARTRARATGDERKGTKEGLIDRMPR
jgi:hypothetical protein